MASIQLIFGFLGILSVVIISEALICPDTSTCSDGTTCCKWSTGKYGCCPLASAQCCSDGLHCCPNGTKCNNKEGTCDQIQTQIRFKVEPKVEITPHLNSTRVNTVCPGSAEQCPDHQTCCPMKSGDWGCCRFPNAICCPDKIHCCPVGTTCGPTRCQR